MTGDITFEVIGTPVSKGNMRAYTPKGWKRPILTDATKNLKAWSASVTEAALEAKGDRPPLEGPVALEVSFFLLRPASAPKRVTVPTKKPDLDKLLRALKDGITRAGIYRDDSQVVVVQARKHFAAGNWDPKGQSGIPRAMVQVGPCTLPKLSPYALFSIEGTL